MAFVNDKIKFGLEQMMKRSDPITGDWSTDKTKKTSETRVEIKDKIVSKAGGYITPDDLLVTGIVSAEAVSGSHITSDGTVREEGVRIDDQNGYLEFDHAEDALWYKTRDGRKFPVDTTNQKKTAAKPIEETKGKPDEHLEKELDLIKGFGEW